MGDLLELRRKAYQSAVKNDNLSPSTLVGYEKAIDRLLKDWDKIQLQDATPSFLRTWIGNLNITSKGVRNMLTPLRSAFEDALNDGLIEHDPFTKIALKKLLRETAKKSEYRADPFDAEERAALIAKARDDERPMVQFWFESGLRPGEIIALAWPKIDWIHHRARIDLNVVAKVEKAPKTAAGLRDLDLSQNALSALTAQKAHTFLAGGRVFHNPRTAEPWEAEPQIRKTFWEPLCKRAGVRYRSPYQVRHTFASVLLGQGHNPWYVAQQMGHEDIDMIFEVYGHWIADSFKKPRLERQITRESHAPAEADATALIHKVKG
jgi:integrase